MNECTHLQIDKLSTTTHDFLYSFQIATENDTEEKMDDIQHHATEIPTSPNATKPEPTDKSDTLIADNTMTVFKTLLSTGKVS